MATTTKIFGFVLLVITTFMALSVSCSSATVYKVGDSDGWTTKDETYNYFWVEDKEFHVGDSLVFEYDPLFNDVTQVSALLLLAEASSSSAGLIKASPTTARGHNSHRSPVTSAVFNHHFRKTSALPLHVSSKFSPLHCLHFILEVATKLALVPFFLVLLQPQNSPSRFCTSQQLFICLELRSTQELFAYELRSAQGFSSRGSKDNYSSDTMLHFQVLPLFNL
ncbi:unnamed protein product [Arabidopsis lyrata]|nr:unnamed protein product [Arabidopsis lyrata]